MVHGNFTWNIITSSGFKLNPIRSLFYLLIMQSIPNGYQQGYHGGIKGNGDDIKENEFISLCQNFPAAISSLFMLLVWP